MSDTIHIVACCDNNYAQHMGIMALSVLSTTATPESIHFHFLTDNLSAENRNRLEQCFSSNRARVSIIDADLTEFAALPVKRYGRAAYLRFQMGRWLDPWIDKAIYLDCDVLVKRDIRKLWEIGLGDQPIAAVENLSPRAHQKLGFERREYFNSGVLLVNVNEWREMDISRRASEFIEHNRQQIVFADQCALNHIFKNRWKRLAACWNQQSDIYRVHKKYARGCGYSKEELLGAIVHPDIIHFTGTQKPWLLNCFHPHKSAYRNYLKNSPWRSTRSADCSTLNQLKHFLSLRKRFYQLSRQARIFIAS